jgi:predicted lipoprotein with Yx(FWY)xxD motif
MRYRFGSIFRAIFCPALLLASIMVASASGAADQVVDDQVAEDYVREPLPAGIHVEQTDMNGPVYADAQGRTLYRWAAQYVGAKNQVSCDDQRVTLSSSSPGGSRNALGEMFYPEGVLPEADRRPTCAQIWPPVVAPADAAAVGKWSIFVRPDGLRQWALNGYPLYTSVLDQLGGDVNGEHIGYIHGDYARIPVGPPADVPPGFSVVSSPIGRLLVNGDSAVFTSEHDSNRQSHCDPACRKVWIPLIAAQLARAQGDWSFVELGQGIRQWAYQGKPLYTYSLDQHSVGLAGTEVSGWHAVVLKPLPPPPSWVTVQDTPVGPVMADAQGNALYMYNCVEPAEGDLPCDNPDTTQVYRLWMCGYNDPKRCLKTWPPVQAPLDAKPSGHTWGVMWINSLSGHRTTEGQPNAMHVWTYRRRPIYTFAGDSPGHIKGDAIGETWGERNGFKAFRIRGEELYPRHGN